MNYNLELRSQILMYSIELEELASVYISRLLYINDWQNTKSFGNGNSSLSFYQKIQLINDMSSSRIDNAKINCFQIVRNKLMHTSQFDSLTQIAEKYREVRTIINPNKNANEEVLILNMQNLFTEIKQQIKSLNDITTSDALTILKSNLAESLFKENRKLNSKLDRIKVLLNAENLDLNSILNIVNNP